MTRSTPRFAVLRPRQQDHVGAGHGPARPADLLVIGDGRLRGTQVHDEAQVRLVETHAQRAGRHQRLELPVQQGALGGEPLLLLVPAGVGADVVAAIARKAAVSWAAATVSV